MKLILTFVMGYIFGSIPWSLIIGKVFYKTDIREHGSGNLGATNAGRTLGSAAAISVATLDLAKALIAVLITDKFISPDLAVYAGVGATVGHCYPLFAQFKGGKAVSTAVGYSIALAILMPQNGIWIVVIAAVTYFGMLYLFKMSSLASMTTVTFLTIALFLLQNNIKYSLSFLLISVIVILRHHENIKRILNKSERKITWM